MEGEHTNEKWCGSPGRSTVVHYKSKSRTYSLLVPIDPIRYLRSYFLPTRLTIPIERITGPVLHHSINFFFGQILQHKGRLRSKNTGADVLPPLFHANMLQKSGTK